MNKDNIMVGIIGLLLGVVITGFVAGQAVNSNNTGMMQMMGMDTAKMQAADHSEMSMADMTAQLKKKSGDEFDKAFIEMMIEHHQGAINMANLIPDRAKHAEIKTLGQAIVTAQTKEITDMKQWQTSWGYSSNEMNQMMHGNY